MWFRTLPRKIFSSFECLSPTLEDVQHGDVLTSNCWLLELEKFIANKSNNKAWFSNSSVSEKNEFEMVHPAWWHISWCILNYLRWEVFRLYTKKVFNCCQSRSSALSALTAELSIVASAVKNSETSFSCKQVFELIDHRLTNGNEGF